MPAIYMIAGNMSSVRTPSSLKWLIDKRARLLGEINKLEKVQAKNVEDAKKRVLEAENSLAQARQELAYVESSVPLIIEVLRNDLHAVDNTLGLHEIQISPDIIPPIRTQDAERHSDHGAMTRAIFERLRLAGGQSVSTFELTDYVAIAIDLKLTDKNYQEFRQKISWRLKNLCAKGKVRRLHQVKGAIVGRWMLPDDPAVLEAVFHPKYGRPRKNPR